MVYYDKTKWANILCHEGVIPFKVIITDGHRIDEISVSGTDIKKLKRLITEMYGVEPSHFLTSEILDGEA